MNPFQCNFEHRLRSWRELRAATMGLPIDQICVAVDKWWQQAPLVNHHLHPQDKVNWPDPWTLLSDNIYCQLTRAVGICYTLLMNGVTDIKLVQASDDLCEDHHLVLVDGSKYVLNYHPGSVLSIELKHFKLSGELPLDILYQYIK